jgi:hypothetical protein
MDINLFVSGWAKLMGQMFVVDPDTGLPTTTHVQTRAAAPFSLAETDLPLWIFFTNAATYPNPPDQSDGRLARETRDFTAVLYVCLVTAGVDGEAERRVRPYVDSARDQIQKHIQLWDGVDADRVPGIKRTYLIRDSGPGQIKYGSTTYNGISYTVRVDADNLVIYDPHQ